MKIPKFLLIILLLYSSSCGYGGRVRPEMTAKVGGSCISGRDVLSRTAIEKAYGNETVTDAVGLVTLVNDAIEYEVGRICGVTATAKDLAALSRHADKTSKAPEILAKVKDACRGDEVAYQRLYLAPRVINRKLRAFHSRSSDIHEHEKTLIERAHALVRSGKSMKEAARVCGLPYSFTKSGENSEATPALLKQYFPQGDRNSANPLTSILENLSENEAYEKIVEDNLTYKVIRLLNKSGSKYNIEMITADKRSFDDWFREQAAQVEVAVLDKNLEKKIVEQYSNIWWVKRWLARQPG